MTNELYVAALEVQSVCTDRGWRFCIIGGMALARWGRPRATQDVDLTLLTGLGDEASFAEALLAKFRARIDDAIEFAQRARVLLITASNGIDIDVGFGALPFEERAIERASWFPYAEGTGLKRVPMSGLLTGKTEMAWDIDPHTAAQVGNTRAKTELQWSLPLRPDQEEDLAYARCSISGVLVGNLSELSDIKSRGVLHPRPARPFSRSLLPDVEFGEIEVDRRSGQLRVRWARGNDE